MGKVIIYKTCNSQVAHLPEIRAAMKAHAVPIANVARGLLRQHRQTGNHAIEVNQGKIDAYVTMTGRSPLSVELGRKPNADGNEGMEGLLILTRAAGLAASASARGPGGA